MLKTSIYLLAAAVLATSFSNKKTMEPKLTTGDEKGWITLFNGTDTTGWHTFKKKAPGKVWQMENGVLHLDPAIRKQSPDEGGDLVTDEEYENFDLKLEWKISPKGNSGIIFYVQDDPKYGATYQTGPEMQVLDNGSPITAGHSDGKLYTHRAGDLYDLLAAKEASKPLGEWNAIQVVCNHGKLDFYMNGQHTLSTTLWDDNWTKMVAISKFKDMPDFGKFKKGRIALQDHGDEVWYRNIRIRKL